MGVGSAGARGNAAFRIEAACSGGWRERLQLILPKLHQASEEFLGLVLLAKFLEGEAAVVVLSLAGCCVTRSIHTARRSRTGRRCRSLPGLLGSLLVAGAGISNAGPIRDFRLMHIGNLENETDGQIGRNGGGGLEILERLRIALGLDFLLGAQNVGFGPMLHDIDILAFGHRKSVDRKS